MPTKKTQTDRPLPLAGKVALVTGAARRVGRAVALALAREGMDVAFTYRASAAEARDLQRRIEALGRQALAIPVDLAEPDAADAVHAAFARRFDHLHALVNNAAIFGRTPLAGLSAGEFDRYLAVNARAPLLLTRRLAALLARGARRGRPESLSRVVNFIDMHALGRPIRGYSAYGASKAALLEITRALALELAPKVTVNAIAPGVVDWAEDFTAAQRKRYLARVPLGRAGTPDDAAGAVVYLVRDAHYVTGQVLRLDGGRWLA